MSKLPDTFTWIDGLTGDPQTWAVNTAQSVVDWIVHSGGQAYIDYRGVDEGCYIVIRSSFSEWDYVSPGYTLSTTSVWFDGFPSARLGEVKYVRQFTITGPVDGE